MATDLSRRHLFRRNKSSAIRPPWVATDIEFTDLCTRCDKCIHSCETKIIHRGDGGFPELNFAIDECTFCQNCVTACPEDIFDLNQSQPWLYIAEIKDTCLAYRGIWCQSCKDACEAEAINFALLINKAPIPTINTDLCIGCGACVSPCPSQAIQISACN